MIKMNKKAIGEKWNKRAMSISIVLLVIMVFVIVGVCLFYFIINERQVGSTIHIPDKIDSLYTRENYLNFYLEDIFEKSAKDFKNSDGASGFINKFKSNLNGYKDKAGSYVISDISQVEAQINENSVQFTDNKLILTLNLKLEDKNEEGITVKYSYLKVFEKNF